MKTSACSTLALAACAAACAGPRLPMSSDALAREREPEALVAFLGQPGASGRACAPGRIDRALLASPGLGRALVAGLQDGKVPPDTFATCALTLLPSLAPGRDSELATACLREAVATLRDPGIEAGPAGATPARFGALERVLVERDPRVDVPRAELTRALDAIAATRRTRALGPAGRGAADALQILVEAERGLWRGRLMDGASCAPASPRRRCRTSARRPWSSRSAWPAMA